jgi:geranylgeranyl diphosphate synthase type I
MASRQRFQRRGLCAEVECCALDIERILLEKAPIINKAIEKYIPRVFSKDDVFFKLNPPRFSYNLEALNKAIAEPVWDLLDRGGKKWRPTFFLLVCEALGKKDEDYVDFAIIPEVVHNGTLMVDDVEDTSERRRGKPCTYKIFGLDVAVNAGNAMYYLPLLPLIEKKDELAPLTISRVYDIYTEEMIALSLGQAADIAWHRGLANADHITEEDYLQMCAYKTGTLARMSAKIAGVLAGAGKELVDKFGTYAETVGIAFQIQDDVLDLTSEEFAEKKGGKGQDITEGKRSLPVVHTMRVASPRDKKRLIEILNMHSSEQSLKDEAIGLIQRSGSIDYSKQVAKNLVEESWSEVEKLLPASVGKEKLKAFADFLIERKI